MTLVTSMTLRAGWLIAIAFASPATARWTAANPQVEAAAKDARVAGALKAAAAIDDATIAGDKDGFLEALAADVVVNNPGNRVADRAVVAQRFGAGTIAYDSFERSIEYAAPRRDDEVLLMGEERLKPRGSADNAGKVVRRRFTDLWRLQNGEWKLSVRQATIISVE